MKKASLRERLTPPVSSCRLLFSERFPVTGRPRSAAKVLVAENDDHVVVVGALRGEGGPRNDEHDKRGERERETDDEQGPGSQVRAGRWLGGHGDDHSSSYSKDAGSQKESPTLRVKTF